MPRSTPRTRSVIRYRTFSKAYGLAGARIGYAIATPEIVEAFDKVRNHYGINRVGQLGALAALGDQAYLAEVVARIARARERIAAIARDHGLDATCPRPPTSWLSIAAAAALLPSACSTASSPGGVFIRKPAVAPLDRCIRVSCGLDADLDMFAAALGPALAEAKAAALAAQ